MAEDSPDILMRYVLTGSLFGQTTQTTFWLRSKENADTDDIPSYLNYLLDDFNTYVVPRIRNCCTSDWEIKQATLSVLAGANDYQAIKSYVLTTGFSSGPSLPPHDALLLSLYTGFHGRRLHGRLYLPAVSETQTAAGLASDELLGELETFGTILTSRYGVNGTSSQVYACVFSKANGVTQILVPPVHLQYNPLAALPISRTVANREIATQRHRKLRRGI